MEGLDIFLAAPTGRAAKRMTETTGFEARTIHRMLEVNGGPDGAGGFERNEQNPLETDVIIIDEMSMVWVTRAAGFSLPSLIIWIASRKSSLLPPEVPTTWVYR